jgi:hypothetical protein
MTLYAPACIAFSMSQQTIGYGTIEFTRNMERAFFIFAWISYVSTTMITSWYVVKSVVKSCNRQTSGTVETENEMPIGMPI